MRTCLQTRRANRLPKDHLDLSTLRILILLDTHFHNHLVKHSYYGFTPVRPGNRQSIVLGVKLVRVFLEGDQTLESKSKSISKRFGAISGIEDDSLGDKDC